ncbi:hypothetical protein FEM48_Zijuj01G0170500 [Ziziphus jujuba var. spinosa]|uniref:NB-ARC domain-containing protein n=1 Tax=Ziziphus jujuba var. spinosa TaxID=714518 RepID=A0A978W2H1_ZIZJJ|nr:hypothetical protein FEM48_Zijuj01G0170500 [Ziziphus jujuba var. spinosa]
MDICGSVFAKTTVDTVKASCQQLNYVTRYKREVEHLTKQVERLRDKRDSVRRAAEAARRNLEPIAPEVERWLRDVDETIQETETCFGNERLAEANRCLRGWCPNLKSRYSLGKKAKKMTVNVDKLLEEGTFQKVSYPPRPPGVSPFSDRAAESEFLIEDVKSNPALHSNMIFHSTQAVSELEMGSTSSATCYPARPLVPMGLSEGFEYKLPFTKEVLEALEDERVKIIGISGLVGGEEAVTLKEFKRRVDHLFEDVATAVVSPNPNLECIQGEIANLLGLDMENKNLIERAKLLSDRMTKASKRFLIILVDIWQTFNLEAVGISHVGVGNGCKIILMSRNPNTFREIRKQRSFKLISVSTSNIGGPILDFESRNSIVRQVMDDLKDDRINPILICGLGGVGKTTMVTQIRDKAKEQGLFDEIVMVDVTRDANIKDIQSDMADYLGLDIYNLSSSTARAQKLYERLSVPKRRLKQEDWPESGLEYEYTSTVLMKGAQTELLLVSGTDFNTTELLGTMFDGMEGLKVLDLKMTHLGRSILSSLPQMKHLQTLCLEHCEISNISMIGQMQTLMILSLRGSTIYESQFSRELPSEIGNLSNLRSLNLTGCCLYKIGQGVLSRLVKLEELYMMGNFERILLYQKQRYADFEREVQEYLMCFSELVFLKNLTTLEAFFPPSLEILQYTIFFEKLDRFYFTQEASEEEYWSDGNYYSGNTLVLNGRNDVVAGNGVNVLLKKARIVYLEEVRFGDLNEIWFVNVKSLTLCHCYGLKYLSDVTLESAPTGAFPMLELLNIDGHDRLKAICHGELPSRSFEELRQLFLTNLPVLTHLWIAPRQSEFLRNLRRVIIKSCHSLESLFLFSTINNLGQLEELDIQDCPKIKEVVTFQGLDEACDIKFPFLIRLNLRRLRSLMGISNAVRRINFHVLITLKLEQLPELTSLFPKNMVLESSSNAAEQYLFDSKVHFLFTCL